MKTFVGMLVLLASLAAAQAVMSINPWTPLFKGVDFAKGTNSPDGTFPRRQAAFFMRLDLTDPDVELFLEPPCTNSNCGAHETVGRTTSEFVQYYQLQGAIDYAYFPQCCGYPSGTPMDVFGLLISKGVTISPDWTPSDYDPDNRDYFTVLEFDQSNVPTFIATNWPPVSTAGVYNALAGDYLLLNEGVPMPGDSAVNPRISVGVSQDGHYLFFGVVDGRNGGYSDGALPREMGLFMQMAGAWNALNADGGGSTTMVRAECFGRPVHINIPTSNGALGTERVVGGHFGFRAKPLEGFVYDVAVVPSLTDAVITWSTLGPAFSQVEYGFTTAYGTATPQDASLTTNHSVVLTGLKPGTNYYFRAVSQAPGQEYWADSCFATSNNLSFGLVFDLTYVWKYATQNLDGVKWQATNYDDARWPSGPGLLCIENNVDVNPKNTILPADPTSGDPLDPSSWFPFVTYYFRSHFLFTNDPAGATLIFSNYLDDGAVFYLNGVELQRAFMPAAPTIITNKTLASGYNCSTTGDATCPYVFSVAGDLLTNLVEGDNVLAVEVHNYNAKSPDIAFGAALFFAVPPPAPRPFVDHVAVQVGETTAQITWTTPTNATTRLEYGLTSDNLNLATPPDPTPTTNHTVTLADLRPATTYYVNAVSQVDTNEYSASSFFNTLDFYQPLLGLTNTLWRYNRNNLEATNWMAVAYSDTVAGWTQGRALLAVSKNPDVYPKNTLLPSSGGIMYPGYYFRIHFRVTNSSPDLVLVFSNYVDDGAVFYLNGAEVQRLRLPPAPQPIGYNTAATAEPPPDGDPIYADVFRLSGALLTNLIVGDNVLAAELHQFPTGTNDAVFGSSVGWARARAAETRLRVSATNSVVGIAWDGPNFVLQQAATLGASNAWADVPGPVRVSPYTRTNPPVSTFYRLRDSGY